MEMGQPELDSLTQLALEMLILVERQAASQLPGGEYWEPSSDLKVSASNVLKTNVVSEHDMAVLDNLLHEKSGQSLLIP